MKKIYLLISAALLSAGAYAQTLNQGNHAMVVGNSYATKQCDSTGVTPGGNGTGQTWNFSTVTIHNSTLKNYNAVTVASTGSAAAYPAAGVAVSAGANQNSFYSSNTTDYKYYGGDIMVGTNAVVLNYSSPLAAARYPMAITNATTSAISGSISAFSNNGTFTGNATVTATGTGTLNLPSMTFPSVIKVVSVQTISFTIILPGTLSMVTTDYYSPAGSKAPMFSIESSTLTSALGNSIQTFAKINSNYLVLGVKEQQDQIALGFEVFPNPASDVVNVSYNNPSNEAVSYEVINTNGQLVKSEKVNSSNGFNKQAISLNGLSSGMYFVRLIVGEKSAVQKINVQ